MARRPSGSRIARPEAAVGPAPFRNRNLTGSVGAAGIIIEEVHQLTGLDAASLDAVIEILTADTSRRPHGLELASVDRRRMVRFGRFK